MNPDFKICALTALIPLLVGFIWYNKKVFGGAWMKSVGMTEDSMKGANMMLIFGLTYVFGFMLSIGISFISIHQYHLYLLVLQSFGPPNPNDLAWYNDAMSHYSHNFRSYRHGLLEGLVLGINVFLPVISVNGLFERRGWKYIAINVGFWTVCAMLIGAILGHWAVVVAP